MHATNVVEELRVMLTLTLQTGIAKMGPLPDECGQTVRSIMAGTDDTAMLALGLYLDDCRMRGNWKGLKESIDAITEAQERRSLR